MEAARQSEKQESTPGQQDLRLRLARRPRPAMPPNEETCPLVPPLIPTIVIKPACAALQQEAKAIRAGLNLVFIYSSDMDG
jgi:hypothetical protein